MTSMDFSVPRLLLCTVKLPVMVEPEENSVFGNASDTWMNPLEPKQPETEKIIF